MKFWKHLLSKLKKKQKVMLLVVVSHKGSSPGRQGFKMCVSEDNELFGSIGGGKTEFQLVEKSKKMLSENNFIPQLINQVHRNKDKDASGMICTGEQLVLLFPLNNKQLEIILEITNSENGSMHISEKGIEIHANTLTPYKYHFKNDMNDWLYQENLFKKPKIFVFGGGHVALATTKLLNALDFNITLFECRKGINTFEENTFVHHKQIIDYHQIKNILLDQTNGYVLIATHGYITDIVILKQLLSSKFKYIGMLGSRAKIKQTFNQLIKEGFSNLQLDKVDAPIGLPINSQTPTEIAVSIAAKLIAVKNQ